MSEQAAYGGREDLEGLAEVIEISGEYRVFRRLRLRPPLPPPDGATIKRGVLIDVETTGLDATADEIVELVIIGIAELHPIIVLWWR